MERLVAPLFANVFPLVPVVDAKDFLKTYALRGINGISVLLLECGAYRCKRKTTLVGRFRAGFQIQHIDKRCILEAGFQSRLAMKQELFSNVKTAFDFAVEADPFIIPQSVTLLEYKVSNFQH